MESCLYVSQIICLVKDNKHQQLHKSYIKSNMYDLYLHLDSCIHTCNYIYVCVSMQMIQYYLLEHLENMTLFILIFFFLQIFLVTLRYVEWQQPMWFYIWCIVLILQKPAVF